MLAKVVLDTTAEEVATAAYRPAAAVTPVKEQPETVRSDADDVTPGDMKPLSGVSVRCATVSVEECVMPTCGGASVTSLMALNGRPNRWYY